MVRRIKTAVLHPRHWWSPGNIKGLLATALCCLSFVAVYAIVTRTFEVSSKDKQIDQLQMQVDSNRDEQACRAAATNAFFLSLGNTTLAQSAHETAMGDLLIQALQHNLNRAEILTQLQQAKALLQDSRPDLQDKLDKVAKAVATCSVLNKTANSK